MDPTILSLGICIFVIGYLFWGKHFTSSLPFPPGPPKLFVLGNIFQMPTGPIWEVFQRWSKEFGSDILHLEVLGVSMVILNSEEAAVDLFDRRSAIYSGRPTSVMVCDLMGYNFLTSSLQYGDTWRQHRRLFQQNFSQQASKKWHAYELEGNELLMRRLLDTPDLYRDHVRHMAGYVMIKLTYGITVLPQDDPYINDAEIALENMAKAAMPGAFLVDTLPFLRYLPESIAGFKRKAKEWKQTVVNMTDRPFQYALQDIKDRGHNDTFVSCCLQKSSSDSKQLEIIKNAAGTVYAGGADTTVSPLLTFILAMILHPSAQAKAHVELDAYFMDNKRLPDTSDLDRDALPYTSAVILETFRWGNIAPLAPHASLEDDIYRGYRIPKGSIVMANMWAILRDEVMYPKPSLFNPDRFLTSDGKFNHQIRDPSKIIFGFGRRICAGRYMATSQISLAITSMLSLFSFSKAIDDVGREIEPDLVYSEGLIACPKPFQCIITPRSDAVEVIRAGYSSYGSEQ